MRENITIKDYMLKKLTNFAAILAVRGNCFLYNMLALGKADARTKREESRFSPLRITPSRKEKFAINFGLILLMTISTLAIANWAAPELQPLKQFFIQQNIATNTWPRLQYINKADLPYPYSFLLTQPLMTIGIAQYYQRTPKVRRPLYAINSTENQTYSRAILMIVDKDKSRNDALAADKLGQSTIAELGLITMNFTALPESIKNDVINTATPFGALLANNNIKVHDTNTHYFRMVCNPIMVQYLNCGLNTTLFGRTNTLVRNDTGQWVAQVVEILAN